jgi:predicted nucleic acid-binding protein
VNNGGVASELHPNTDVVVDASIVVKWFIEEVHSNEAVRLLEAKFRPHIPALLYSEVAQTIWKKVYLRHEIAAEDGREILRDLMVIPLEVHAITPLLEQALEIALSTGRTVYDSIYLALAVSLNTKLVTADRKLYNALHTGPFSDDVLWVRDRIWL